MKTVVATVAVTVAMSVLVGGVADAGLVRRAAPQASPLALASLKPISSSPLSLRSELPVPQVNLDQNPLSFRGVQRGTIPPESPVADAAMRNDAEGVRTLVKQGADVNAAQGDGMTALHWAAQNGQVELVELLVYAGANPKAVTRNGAYTPLHLAAKAANPAVVRALLKAGSNPNSATSTGGATPLHFAAASGNAEAVAALLEAGADANARETAWDQTPLMWAAAYNHPDAIKVLLQRGADIAAKSKVENVAEIEKSARADERRRNERLKAIAAVDQPRQPSAAPAGEEAASRSRGAPAGAGGQEQAGRPGQGQAQSQEAQGQAANPDVPAGYGELVGKKGGLTPLLFAVRQGHTESALALLEAGADINQVSGDNTTALLMAAINGHFDLAKVLLEKGANPNLASDAGATPLYAVINMQWAPKALYPQPTAYLQQQTTYLDLMEALLKAGADPNVRLQKHLWYMEYNFSLLEVDTKGATPFWRAAYGTDVEAMKLLMKYGADPTIPTMKPAPRRFRRGGETETKDPSGLPPIPVGGPGVYPIHAASGVGYGEGYAANSHRHAPDGWLPAVKYLIEELGADVNQRDHNGYNAIHHAAARGDNELIKYLVEKGGDVKAVSRKGQTTADMANGPVQRVPPFLDTVKLLESLGSKNNNKCMSC